MNVINKYDVFESTDHIIIEKEKLVLDQYTMSGGKSLWLIDAVAMEKDSLYNSGQSIAIPRNLILTDFFFKYGIRINPVLVNTVYSAPITLAVGEDNNTQLQELQAELDALKAELNK